jgi:SAM-dependent methyltransferase
MTTRVDYDAIARVYSSRYQRNDYSGVTKAVKDFLATGDVPGSALALDVGCGTGYWLQVVRQLGTRVVGVDLSAGMLRVARDTMPAAPLARARAEALPFPSGSFDRVFCINALHHFTDRGAFFVDAHRVLREGGALLIVGLDPHTGCDRWWIYEYFPESLMADLKRFLSTAAIRDMMTSAGFERCETREIQHLPRSLRLTEAEREGFLSRTSGSQLLVISDEEYERGLARIRADAANAPDELVLHADLRLYGTTGRLKS